MEADNLRRFQRHERKLSASLSLSWGDLDGTIENIGEGGTFFVTDTLEGAVDEGDRLEVRIDPALHENPIPGVVLRVERYFHDGGLFRAFAVKFDHPVKIELPPEPEAAE